MDVGVFGYVFAKLSGVKQGRDDWKARCPAHSDRDRSLNIRIGKEGLLLHCHAGCSFASVCRAIGVEPKELFTIYHERKSRMSLVTYDYCDAAGTLLYQTVRKEPKGFFQRRPDPESEGNWINSLGEVDRVLYRLPELLSADPARFVLIPEGEKDVDRLCGVGLVSTCNVGGVGKWRDEYSKHLKGRNVVILPDNDPPAVWPEQHEDAGKIRYHDDGLPVRAGWDHACDIAASVAPHAKSVRVLLLPGLPEKGDVSDWLDAGNEPIAMKPLIDDCPVWDGDRRHPLDREPAAANEEPAEQTGSQDQGQPPAEEDQPADDLGDDNGRPAAGDSPDDSPADSPKQSETSREALLYVKLAEEIKKRRVEHPDDKTFVLVCRGLFATGSNIMVVEEIRHAASQGR